MTPAPILRGPADADHYRVKVGRYRERWYVDPLPACDIAPASDGQWPSISSVKNASGSDWTYVALKRVAKALEVNPHALDMLGFADRYDRLIGMNKSDLRRAQNRGTMVHSYLERGLRGLPMESPFDSNEGKDYLPAVRDFFNTYGPRLVAAELVCINRDLNGVGYGGTADALITIDNKPTIFLPDWKSRGEDSSHDAYPEEAAQLGGYHLADYYIGEGPKRMRMPDVDSGLIVSIKPDGVRIYPIDLAKAGERFTALHAWWVATRNDRASIGKPWAPRSAPPSITSAALDDLIATADTYAALLALHAAHAGVWSPAHTELAAARKALIEGGLVA